MIALIVLAPHLTAAALCLLPSVSRDSADKNAAPPAAVCAFHAPDRSAKVYLDEPGDGRIWARGANYKASFGPEGAQFVPFLGSDAPRNYPLALAFTSASVGGALLAVPTSQEPERKGAKVEYRRQGVLERYELFPGSIEQTFVFETLAVRGELVVRLALASELVGCVTSEGLRFANELGGVDYSRASAIDSTGRRTSCATLLDGDVIELRVPAEFVAQASLPLTIDPAITGFSVATTTSYEAASDSAYDRSTDTFVVVYEFQWSGGDSDVLAQQYYANGTPVPGGLAHVDATSVPWREPRIANLDDAELYLVVAEAGQGWPWGPRAIRARTVQALSLNVGPEISIATSASDDLFHPDVGGDPSASSGSLWCVTWEVDWLGGENDLQYQLVRRDGSLYFAFTQYLNNSTWHDEHPVISKSNGGTAWNVVWQREYSLSDHDIYGARIDWAGNLIDPSIGIDVSTANDFIPKPSSRLRSSTDWLAVYTRSDGTQVDVCGALVAGNVPVHWTDLTALEHSGTQALDQMDADVESDGDGFAVAYWEPYSPSDYDIYVSTFALAGGVIYASEAHQALATSTTNEWQPRVSSFGNSGGAAGRYVVTWQELFPSLDSDVKGALWLAEDFTSFCHPGQQGVAACPCANPPASIGRGCNNSSNTGGAQLTQTGTARLSNDDVVFVTNGQKPTATSIVLQGQAAIDAGSVFGQGVRCMGTNLKRLYVKAASGGSITAPAFGDLSVSVRSATLGDPLSSGSRRYYLVYYRDPVVLGGCPLTSTFNATQGGVIAWRP